MNEKLEQIIAEEGFAERLVACETAEEAQALFAEKGIELTLDDIKAISNGLANNFDESDELDEDSLDGVAGGAMIRQSALAVIGTVTAVFNKKKFFDKRRLHQAFRRW